MVAPRKFIDGLVVIADNADIVGAAREQAHQMELGNTGVLILIHNYVLERILVVLRQASSSFCSSLTVWKIRSSKSIAPAFFSRAA